MKVRIAALCSLTLAAIAAYAAPKYSIKDLGTLGSDYSYGYGVNNLGQVTGDSMRAFYERGFLYSDGKMTDLEEPLGIDRHAKGINDRGQIVGFKGTGGGAKDRGFLYKDGVFTDLGTLGGTFCAGYGVNDLGWTTGESGTVNGGQVHAFLNTGGAMLDLGTLGGSLSRGYGVNHHGDVTGASFTGEDSAMRAFLYTGGQMRDLGTLGGKHSVAKAVNDLGQVTGEADRPNGESYAFLYSNGHMIDLGAIGGTYSVGYGINGLGQVVGKADSGSGYKAFLYMDGAMLNLDNCLDASGTGWKLKEARSISDAGYITGFGEHNGLPHAYMLTPVPEPASLAALAFGASWLGLRRKRRA
jgi:probable HAF family extracellular repeat protein